MNNRYICKAKRKDNNEWVEGYYVCNGEHCYIFSGKLGIINKHFNWERYEVIPETVCRCTGLQDKNGKWIFEGDVVIDKYSCERFGFVGVVIYNNERTQFQIFNKHQPQYVVNLGSLRDSIRILGNSIDNPELLEVER